MNKMWVLFVVLGFSGCAEWIPQDFSGADNPIPSPAPYAYEQDENAGYHRGPEDRERLREVFVEKFNAMKDIIASKEEKITYENPATGTVYTVIEKRVRVNAPRLFHEADFDHNGETKETWANAEREANSDAKGASMLREYAEVHDKTFKAGVVVKYKYQLHMPDRDTHKFVVDIKPDAVYYEELNGTRRTAPPTLVEWGDYEHAQTAVEIYNVVEGKESRGEHKRGSRS